MDKKNIIIVIAVVFLLGFGYWYFTLYESGPDPTEERAQKIEEADKLHHSSDAQKSIEIHEDLIASSEDRREANRLRYSLTNDLLRRGEPGDRERFAAILKEMAADEENPPDQRAAAIMELVNYWFAAYDEEFAREHIFKGEPLEKLLIEAKKEARKYGASNADADIYDAARKAYEMGEELYPLAIPEFRIALWYRGVLDGGRATSKEREELAYNLMKEWTLKGEQNMEVFIRARQESKARIAFLHQLHASAQFGVAKYGDGDYSKAEQACRSGLDVLSQESSVHTYTTGQFLRFHCAGMLSEIYGEERVDDLKFLLDPIINVPPQYQNVDFSFYKFLREEADPAHAAHSHNEDIIRLTELVPEFKEFLDSQNIPIPSHN